MGVQAEYERWLNSPKVSLEDKELLRQMSREEIDDAFFKNVEFGTAGMRGVLGPGTNRMNVFTIKKATVAFAQYLNKTFIDAATRGVVIAHDNRHQSRAFTLEAAEVLNKMGLKTFLFDSLRPTPELSFAVRKMKACAGIMITASHNPKEYNGYKVYDENGCQLVPEKIEPFLRLLAKLPPELEVEIPESEQEGETILLSRTIDDEYVNLVLSIRLQPDLPKDDYPIVFTPQHGTSFVNAMRIFKEAGYVILPVEDQCGPDPDFSHTLTPNPEEKKAYVEAMELAKKENAPLILTTDPDADRVGVAYRDSHGEYRYLNGNQSGAMLLDYLLKERQAQGLLAPNGVIFNTIVTSELGAEIARSYGVKVESLLTGFKYIGQRIHEYEVNGGPTFEFGYEESYGCLIAPFARDKDGLQALLMLAEMAVYYHRQGLCLDEVLTNIYQRLGRYYADEQYSKFFKGESGSKDMQALMKNLRKLPIKELAGLPLVRFEDYLKGESYEHGRSTPILLPKADVVKLIFEGGSSIAIRPSGTEPKCKFYISAVGKSEDEVKNLPSLLYQEFAKLLNL